MINLRALQDRKSQTLKHGKGAEEANKKEKEPTDINR